MPTPSQYVGSVCRDPDTAEFLNAADISSVGEVRNMAANPTEFATNIKEIVGRTMSQRQFTDLKKLWKVIWDEREATAHIEAAMPDDLLHEHAPEVEKPLMELAIPAPKAASAVKSDRTRKIVDPGTRASRALEKLSRDVGENLIGASLERIEQAKKTREVRPLIQHFDECYATMQTVGLVPRLAAECMEAATSTEDYYQLVEAALRKGSAKSIGANRRSWTKIVKWFRENATSDDSVYPTKSSTFAKFLNWFRTRNVRIGAPELMKSAVLWIHRRFGMDSSEITASSLIPGLISMIGEAKKFVAPVDKVTWDTESIAKLERFVMDETQSPVERLLVGTILLMCYASLRFDDALHSPPDLMQLVTGILLGVAWQTKVDRKKRGTRWSASRGSVTGCDWVEVWFGLLKDSVHTKRDYLLEAPTSDRTAFQKGVPISYEVFVASVVPVMRRIGIPEHLIAHGVHLCKRWATTMGAYGGESQMPLKLQGHWATDRMTVEYTAFGRLLPVQMMQRLLARVRRGWKPAYEGANDMAPRPAPANVDAPPPDEERLSRPAEHRITTLAKEIIGELKQPSPKPGVNRPRPRDPRMGGGRVAGAPRFLPWDPPGEPAPERRTPPGSPGGLRVASPTGLRKRPRSPPSGQRPRGSTDEVESEAAPLTPLREEEEEEASDDGFGPVLPVRKETRGWAEPEREADRERDPEIRALLDDDGWLEEALGLGPTTPLDHCEVEVPEDKGYAPGMNAAWASHLEAIQAMSDQVGSLVREDATEPGASGIKTDDGVPSALLDEVDESAGQVEDGSEGSDGEADVEGTATLYEETRTETSTAFAPLRGGFLAPSSRKVVRVTHHVASAIEAALTACRNAPPLARMTIADKDLEEVPIGSICEACVLARPSVFTDQIVETHLRAKAVREGQIKID